MQLSLRTENMMAPQIKIEKIDLQDELVEQINSIKDESSKLELILKLAPIANEPVLHKLRQVALGFNDIYLRTRALMILFQYLYYLNLNSYSWKNNQGSTLKTELLRTILRLVDKEHKQSLMGKFIDYGYGVLCEEFIGIIRENFDLLGQSYLLGKLFTLSMWWPVNELTDKSPEFCLYRRERERIISEAEAPKEPKDKYLVLVALLKEFVLNENRERYVASLCLEALKANAASKSEVVKLEEKIDLLQFLFKETKKEFLLELYKELGEGNVPSISEAAKLIKFFVCCSEKCNPQETAWTVIESEINDILNQIKYVFNPSTQEQEKYCEIIGLLSKTFLGMINSSIEVKSVLELKDSIKSPMIKIDSTLLVLEEIKTPKLKKQLLAEALNQLSLIKDNDEIIVLSTRLLEYVDKTTKKDIAASLLARIGWISEESRNAEFLVGLLPHLTHKQVKQAFKIAESTANSFHRVWTLIAFAPYLREAKREEAIKKAVDYLKVCVSSIEKGLLIKQLIAFSYFNKLL